MRATLHNLIVIYSIGLFAFGASAQTESNKKKDPMPESVREAKVKKTVKHKRGQTEVILQMIEDPGIPAPPPPPPPLTEEQRVAIRNSPEIQARLAEYKEMKIIHLSATVVDKKRTLLRWWHEKEEYRAWSTIDFNYFKGVNAFELENQRFLLFMGIGDIDSTHSHYTHSEIYDYPKLRGKGPRFEVIQGNENHAEAIDSIKSLHHYFRENKGEMKRAHRQRERQNTKRLQDLKDNPPEPKDTVIKFWPRKGSRYLKQNKKGESK